MDQDAVVAATRACIEPQLDGEAHPLLLQAVLAPAARRYVQATAVHSRLRTLREGIAQRLSAQTWASITEQCSLEGPSGPAHSGEGLEAVQIAVRDVLDDAWVEFEADLSMRVGCAAVWPPVSLKDGRVWGAALQEVMSERGMLPGEHKGEVEEGLGTSSAAADVGDDMGSGSGAVPSEEALACVDVDALEKEALRWNAGASEMPKCDMMMIPIDWSALLVVIHTPL